jgi:hypothetical protein
MQHRLARYYGNKGWVKNFDFDSNNKKVSGSLKNMPNKRNNKIIGF